MRWIRVPMGIVGVIVVGGPLPAQSANVKPAPARGVQHVVFVCDHGTVKSLVALEVFNRLAAARGLRAEASSRGTKPDAQVPVVVRNGLAADGFDVRAFRAQLFTRRDVAPGALVVALDADVDSVVAGRATVVRWDGLPSVLANYTEARTAITARVRRLVDSLAAVKPLGRRSASPHSPRRSTIAMAPRRP